MIPVTYPAANVINNENPDISESGLEIGPPVVGQNRAIGASGLNGLYECNKKKHNGGSTLPVVGSLAVQSVLSVIPKTPPGIGGTSEYQVENGALSKNFPSPVLQTDATSLPPESVVGVELCPENRKP